MVAQGLALHPSAPARWHSQHTGPAVKARATVRRGGMPRTRPRSPGKRPLSTRRHTRCGGPPATGCAPPPSIATAPHAGAARAPDRTRGGTRRPSDDRPRFLVQPGADATGLQSAARRERPATQPGSVPPQPYGTPCARRRAGERPRAGCVQRQPRPTRRSGAVPPAGGRPGCPVGAGQQTTGAAARTRAPAPPLGS